jgi:hypothetical protein
MTPNEILNLLLSFEKRLERIAEQAHETCEQAQHTLDRINRLRRDVDLLKDSLVAAMETVQSEPNTREVPPASPSDSGTSSG